MIGRFLNKNILKVAIGIPIVLLIISLLLATNKNSFQNINSTINPYFKTLPSKYVDAFVNNNKNDSTFFSATIENFGIRELIIFKEVPTTLEKRTDFTVELYPSNSTVQNSNKAIQSLNIKNDAAIYSYNDKIVGVFRAALPFIDLEKLIVKTKSWESIIEKPFKYLSKKFEFKKIEGKITKSDANPYNTLFTNALNNLEIKNLPYSYITVGDSIFQINEDFDQYLTQNNQTIGVIEKENQFWSLLNRKHAALSSNIKFKGEKSENANLLIERFVKGETSFETIFNIKKLADYYALRNVFSNSCVETFYISYNPEKDILEPFFAQSDCLGLRPKNIEKPKINNPLFINTYIQSLYWISRTNFYENLLKENKSFRSELAQLNKMNPNMIFDFNTIELNQKIIKKSLNPTASIITELLSYNNRKMELVISNEAIFPINIIALNYKANKEITKLSSPQKILANQRDTITIELPRSFENLFVSKKTKIAGFNLYKDIYDLRILFSISSLNETYVAPIVPFIQEKEINSFQDLLRKASTIQSQEGVVINNQNKTITFSQDTITIDSPLIIPKGFMFKVNPGTTINIVNGGKIISHAPLTFLGTKEKPIRIDSSDKKGQGLFVLSNGQQSILKHVYFDNLTNLKHGHWNITGAVSFYESPVVMENVSISNNRCEDALNIIRTSFEMRNCHISNTQSDAFDGDFVTGTIFGSSFTHLGNDAIDVSGSNLKINNVTISDAGDKGLSAGEDSQMTINNVTISDSEIAIAGKDLSIINAKNLKITNTKLGFTAFQKKPEFGPSKITVNLVEMEGIETKYLIENTSSMKVDGVKIETSQNVKDRMYGVEFGVSSDKTRNSNK